jgi:hypothetical protein
MNVLWDGSIIDQPTFAYTGQGPDNMEWTLHIDAVTGTGSDTLEFQSTTPNNYGPALDNISLSVVPEPPTLCLAFIGLLGIGLAKYAQNSHAAKSRRG